jgi:general secretion pathway protein G
MRRRDRAGFTLIEVLIAVAIVAILAGAITPLVYREMMAAREDATRAELATLDDGLQDFFADVGRLPTEGEGLAALVADPGIAGWDGPYVGGGGGIPTQEVATDGFGNDYVYDLAPSTTPAGVADLLIVSGGSDHGLDAGVLNGLWDLDATGDDLVLVVNLGARNRENERAAQRELETLADAMRAYYAANAAFPATLNDLVGDYLDAGFNGEALVDPWQRGYVRIVDAGPPAVARLRSWGPDRADDGGGDDDLEVTVSSAPPGRETTLFKLEIAQAALNAQPGLVLSGVWSGGDRAALGLDPVFDRDGWGRDFGINVGSRTVFSAGPDGNAGLTADNLPMGVGP